MPARCVLLRPGTIAYGDALDLQRRTAERVRAGAPPTLILLQHPHTYTLGARGETASLLLAESAYRARGADVFRSDRGGDVTYHGPGQVVGYPIVNLRTQSLGAVTYVRAIEQVMIDALATFGIDAARSAGRPGVWINNEKIGAIGVKISGGVSTHGFALNVHTDLSWFESIVPCGIAGARVTSMRRFADRDFAHEDVEDALATAFGRVFRLDIAEETVTEAAGGR
jgi:lipoate-protein ligase B